MFVLVQCKDKPFAVDCSDTNGRTCYEDTILIDLFFYNFFFVRDNLFDGCKASNHVIVRSCTEVLQKANLVLYSSLVYRM